MALQPLDRPAGSSQFIRFRGTVTAGEAVATYPKTNGTYPSDSVVDQGGFFTSWVRFALWDATPDLTDTEKRLPAHVFDDEQPSEDAPHAYVLATVSNPIGINTTDRTINTRTWAQNVQIHHNKISQLVLIADAAVAVDNNPANGAMVLLDQGASSGLGRSTGLPVIAVKFLVTANDGAVQDFDVDITFEVTHSSSR